MIYRFTGVPEIELVKLTVKNKTMGYCSKNQVLVNTDFDYKNSDIIDLEGDKVDCSKFGGFYFIPKNDTEKFIETREYDFESLSKRELDYVEE